MYDMREFGFNVMLELARDEAHGVPKCLSIVVAWVAEESGDDYQP